MRRVITLVLAVLLLVAGSVAAAWAAQKRPEVDHVVGLAPLVNLPHPRPVRAAGGRGRHQRARLGHDVVDDAVNSGEFDEIYPILMDLFTEGEVVTEPMAPPLAQSSVGSRRERYLRVPFGTVPRS
jgi:hypothetical protein